jgi:hypothetical protein
LNSADFQATCLGFPQRLTTENGQLRQFDPKGFQNCLGPSRFTARLLWAADFGYNSMSDAMANGENWHLTTDGRS